MKFNEQTYIDYDPFSGSDRDVDIRNHKAKIVTVRKEHDCLLAPLLGRKVHTIKIGEKARNDTAIVDELWGSYYSCIDCMDHWLINSWGLTPKSTK